MLFSIKYTYLTYGAGDMDDDVGTRLRGLREQRGFSQRKLAHGAGLSSATISMIENAKISPSVGTLRRIVESMGLTIAEFFSPTPAGDDPVFFPSEQLVEIGIGDISYRQVGASLRDKPLQILHELYPSGSDTGRNSLQHHGFEGGIIISGRLEVTVGRQKQSWVRAMHISSTVRCRIDSAIPGLDPVGLLVRVRRQAFE
jgi:transcriptional regulator with XRE-family HTH domain